MVNPSEPGLLLFLIIFLWKIIILHGMFARLKGFAFHYLKQVHSVSSVNL